MAKKRVNVKGHVSPKGGKGDIRYHYGVYDAYLQGYVMTPGNWSLSLKTARERAEWEAREMGAKKYTIAETGEDNEVIRQTVYHV